MACYHQAYMASQKSDEPLISYPLRAAVGLSVIHLCALAVFLPGMFSWSGLLVAFVLYWVTGAFGITLSFHRLLTHRSMKIWKPLEYVFGLFGTLALQGGPVEWVAIHRAHHAHTDKPGDPHDVNKGLTWAHLVWLVRRNDAIPSVDEQRRLAADVAGEPYYAMLERMHVPLQIVLGVALFLMGGWSWVVLGIFVRLVATYHITWLVNSASHHSGYRTYRTTDKSTNNWVVGLLAWGEGWHNNHHAFPSSARHGLGRFEIDTTWWVIRGLELLRLAKDVKVPSSALRARYALVQD